MLLFSECCNTEQKFFILKNTPRKFKILFQRFFLFFFYFFRTAIYFLLCSAEIDQEVSNTTELCNNEYQGTQLGFSGRNLNFEFSWVEFNTSTSKVTVPKIFSFVGITIVIFELPRRV